MPGGGNPLPCPLVPPPALLFFQMYVFKILYIENSGESHPPTSNAPIIFPPFLLPHLLSPSFPSNVCSNALIQFYPPREDVYFPPYPILVHRYPSLTVGGPLFGRCTWPRFGKFRSALVFSLNICLKYYPPPLLWSSPFACLMLPVLFFPSAG